MKFVPVAAMQGVNLVSMKGGEATELRQWYKGSTLADYLGLRYQSSLDDIES